MLLAAAGAPLGSYPNNFALDFKSGHRDVVRVPHEASMNGPLIDSWTVELWVRASKRQQQPATGHHVNLLSFPGRHPSVSMSTNGYATASLRTSNGTWYSYEGATQINDGQVRRRAVCTPGAGGRPPDTTLPLLPPHPSTADPASHAVAPRRRDLGRDQR